MSKSQNTAPIYINLTGVCVVPVKATHHVYADTLKGDARLQMLDAFLVSLSESNKDAVSRGDYSFSDALQGFVKKCSPTLLERCDVIMEVTSHLDTNKHEIKHTFKITTQAR